MEERQTAEAKARALHNKRVIQQVRRQVRTTQGRGQAVENIDRMMRQNRSVCG